MATIAVMTREGEDPAAVGPGVAIPSHVVPVTRIDVSATDVRERARQGRSIRHLVPQAAHRIIEREELYSPPTVQHV